ncbi:hypothetical protein BKA93DRAFT_824895 [Sparassis latifolia]
MDNLHDDAFSGQLTAENLRRYLQYDRSIIDEPGGFANLTPLAAASFHGHLDVVKLLLDHVANPDALSPGNRTALFYVTSRKVRCNQLAIVRALLDAGAKIDKCYDDDGRNTPLMNAIQQLGDKEIVHELVNRGASLTLTNLEGETIKMIAKVRGMEHDVRLRADRELPRAELANFVAAAVMLAVAVGNGGPMEDVLRDAITKLCCASGEKFDGLMDEKSTSRRTADYGTRYTSPATAVEHSGNHLPEVVAEASAEDPSGLSRAHSETTTAVAGHAVEAKAVETTALLDDVAHVPAAVPGKAAAREATVTMTQTVEATGETAITLTQTVNIASPIHNERAVSSKSENAVQDRAVGSGDVATKAARHSPVSLGVTSDAAGEAAVIEVETGKVPRDEQSSVEITSADCAQAQDTEDKTANPSVAISDCDRVNPQQYDRSTDAGVREDIEQFGLQKPPQRHRGLSRWLRQSLRMQRIPAAESALSTGIRAPAVEYRATEGCSSPGARITPGGIAKGTTKSTVENITQPTTVENPQNLTAGNESFKADEESSQAGDEAFNAADDESLKADDELVQHVSINAASLLNNPNGCYTDPENVERVKTLSLYQLVIYCDDSGSMGYDRLYEHQCELVRRIVTIATKLVPDDYGVDLHFINAPSAYNLSDHGIEARMKQVKPSGGTSIGYNLRRKILEPLVYKRMASGERFERPILIWTITDGEPDRTDQPSFKDAIVECRKNLVMHGYRPTAVRFCVSQIGNSWDAVNFLNGLRDDSEISDVVHCTTDRLDDKFKELKNAEGKLEEWLLKTLTEHIMTKK